MYFVSLFVKLCLIVFFVNLTSIESITLSENQDKILISEIASKLTNADHFNKCTLVLWQSNKIFNSNKFDTIIPNFSKQFTSILLYQNNSLTDSSILPLSKNKLHDSCSVVIYSNLDYFHNFKKSPVFPTNWFQRLPGGFPRSYHLIFYSHNSKEFVLSKLPTPLNQMIHRIFISISNTNQGLLWTCDIFGTNCRLIQEPKEAQEVLTTNAVNLNLAPLIWSAVTIPTVNQKEFQDFIKYRRNINIHITPYVEISERFNATPTLRLVPTQNFGTLDKATGKWEGAAGEVVMGRAHISAGLLTPDRYEALFLSKTIDTDGLTFATGPPYPVLGSPFFLLDSYQWQVWTALGIVVVFLVIISQQISKNSVAMFVISPLLEQPAETRNYQQFIKGSSSRWMFGPWLLSLVVLGTTFKTSLISTLTLPTVKNPPTNFKSLIESKYDLNFLGATTTAGAVFNDMKSKGNLLVNQLDKRIVKKYDLAHSDGCISQSSVCLGISYVVLEVCIRHLTEESGEPMYRISGEFLYSSFYAFYVSKELPHLLGEVNKMMFHYAESGNYQMFRANVVKSAQKFVKLAANQRNKSNGNHHHQQMISESQKRSKKSSSYHHDELDTVLRTTVVLGMGFGIASMVLFCEILWYHLLSRIVL